MLKQKFSSMNYVNIVDAVLKAITGTYVVSQANFFLQGFVHVEVKTHQDYSRNAAENGSKLLWPKFQIQKDVLTHAFSKDNSLQ